MTTTSYTIHGSAAVAAAAEGPIAVNRVETAIAIATKIEWDWALGEFPLVEITDDATGEVVARFIGGERYFD